MNKGRKISSVSRREFIISTGIVGTAITVTLSSCKGFFRNRKKDQLIYEEREKTILHAVLLHLFPASPDSPGADDINAIGYLTWAINDPNLRISQKQLLLSGINWTEETSTEMYQDQFINLDEEQKENVLRDLEKYSRGRRWLSLLLTYLFEALLSDPLYGSNKKEIGWKWLGHIPGSPRPTKDQIYRAS